MNTHDLKYMYDEPRASIQYDTCPILMRYELLLAELEAIDPSLRTKPFNDIKQSLIQSKRCDKYQSCKLCNNNYFQGS